MAGLVLRHRRLVAVFWLAVTVAGVLLAGQVTGRFSSAQALPGLPSYQAAEVLRQSYGIGDNPPIAVLITLPAVERITSAAGRSDLTRILAPVSADRSLRAVSYLSTGDHKLISGDGRSALTLVYGGTNPPTSAQLTSQLRSSAPPGVTVHATSLNDLSSGGSSGGIGVLGEGVIAGLAALLVLAVVFGPLLALLPLIIAVVSILTTFLLIGLVSTVAPVSSLVEFLIALIGLGVAIDYSLLMITRWREERARGLSNEDAVARAMSTAGRSIAFSALIVAVGLLSLVLLPIPFLRSLGYAGLLIPIVSALVALTLLPVILAGPARRLGHARRRRQDATGRRWHAWASLVIRHRLLAAVAALAILGTLLGFATRLSVGEPRPDSQATSGAAYDGLAALRQAGFPDGVLAPVDIVAPDGAVSALSSRLTALPGVYATLTARGTAWHQAGTAVVQVLPVGPTSSPAGKATVSDVRSETARISPRALVTGDGPLEADFVSALYNRFPAILGLVAALTLLLLMYAFRSVVLAVQALILNVLSVGASYGALVLIWQYGYGSKAIWGIPATGVIVDFVPLLVFAFQFGLSMDYEVFIVSRIREEHDTEPATDNAVVQGIARTGRLVTSAALILFLAFTALAAGPQTSIKIFATGLGVGILLDATVVRSLLLPALISLSGSWNWWLPRLFARLMRVPSDPR
jgi:putative drug exporter of the RND superfamily